MDEFEAPPQWAIAATQNNNNQDRFLAGLGIPERDTSWFVQLLRRKCLPEPQYVSDLYKWLYGPDSEFMAWLAAKPVEWLQQMYSLLLGEAASSYTRGRLLPLQIIRLSDDTFSVGSKCYFPTDDIEQDKGFPRVDRSVYSSGKSTTEQTEAKKFLEAMGVREVGEVEQIENVLKQRYMHGNLRPELNDMDRFIRFVETEPSKASIFKEFLIFKLSTGRWGKPIAVYLDLPYLDTGLTAFYDALGTHADRWPLSTAYESISHPIEDMRNFALAVGVQTKLNAVKQPVSEHPQSYSLTSDYYNGARRTSTVIDVDWFVPGLDTVIGNESEALSRLLWKTLCDTPKAALWAFFRPNQQYQINKASSSLVLLVSESAWIPQTHGDSVDFVRPSEAIRDLLPKGFPYDAGYEWLKAVRFGENERQRSVAYKAKQDSARELGIVGEEALQYAQWIAGLPSEERQRVKAEYERKQQIELPEHDSKNPERRAAHVAQLAADAPERITELRTRSVSVGLDDVKQQAEQYLRQQYTNADGEMICQVCKDLLPFTLDDGSYYFEKVEFLPELQRRHHQNYLALCPNHAAMFQYVNGSRELMSEMLLDLDGNELEVFLAREYKTIHFTKTHIADIKTVIAVETDEAEGDEAE